MRRAGPLSHCLTRKRWKLVCKGSPYFQHTRVNVTVPGPSTWNHQRGNPDVSLISAVSHVQSRLTPAVVFAPLCRRQSRGSASSFAPDVPPSEEMSGQARSYSHKLRVGQRYHTAHVHETSPIPMLRTTYSKPSSPPPYTQYTASDRPHHYHALLTVQRRPHRSAPPLSAISPPASSPIKDVIRSDLNPRRILRPTAQPNKPPPPFQASHVASLPASIVRCHTKAAILPCCATRILSDLTRVSFVMRVSPLSAVPRTHASPFSHTRCCATL